MTKAKKPKPEPVVFVRVPVALRVALDAAVKEERRTVREVVVAALRAYLGAP